ncbi:hypothetical protein EOM57_05920 [Candidatus Saccharibacteria bacterium]|nr:hypothetical protein [Candidatus Saccharibacteria bacterium]
MTISGMIKRANLLLKQAEDLELEQQLDYLVGPGSLISGMQGTIFKNKDMHRARLAAEAATALLYKDKYDRMLQ